MRTSSKYSVENGIFRASTPSGMFFEFLQRNPNAEMMRKIEERNRESWFRDKTFLGLYGEKEKEYRSGKGTPFIDFELFQASTKKWAIRSSGRSPKPISR